MFIIIQKVTPNIKLLECKQTTLEIWATACFLRAVQSVFLQKRHLETADVSTGSTQRLYEPPLDMFGADAVERWFTEKEVEEVVEFANRMAM